jgi:hypothetical protein
VQLWHWKADLEGEAARSAEEVVARGWRQPARTQPEDQQQLTAKARWDEGRWRVVIKRPLVTEDRNDVQFTPGRFIPLAVNAWDGSNGEHGMIMSLSSWYFVLIEAPTPITVYVYSALSVLVVGGLGIWLMRKAMRSDDQRPDVARSAT